MEENNIQHRYSHLGNRGQPVKRWNKKETPAEIHARNKDEQFLASEYRSGTILFPVAISTHSRYEYLIKRMIRSFHDSEHRDKEVMRVGLVQRMCEFLSLLVAESSTSVYDPVKDITTEQFCYFGTLRTWRHDILSILRYKFGSKLPKDLYQELKSHQVQLVNKYSIQGQKLQRLTFSTGEVRALLKSILYGTHRKSFDVSLQLAAIIVLFYYTGARPGSIVATQDYPTFLKASTSAASPYNQYHCCSSLLSTPYYSHIQISQLKFTRAKEDGRTVGLNVEISIEDWKGYQLGERQRVEFFIGAVHNRINLMYELGILLVTSLFRRGAWGDTKTLDELWDGEGIFLPPVRQEYMNQAVFLRSRGGGAGLMLDNPLKDAALRQSFRREVQVTGLDQVLEPGARAHLGVYCIRRGTASSMLEAFGAEVTKKYLGHKAGSATLHAIYDQSHRMSDLRTILDREKPNAQVVINGAKLPHLYVPEGYTQKKDAPLLSEMIQSDPQLMQSCHDLHGLEKCIAASSDDWMKFPAWKDSTDWKSDEVYHCLLLVKKDIKLRIQEWKNKQKREVVLSRDEAWGIELSKTIQQRFKEGDTVDSLPEDLKQQAATLQERIVGKSNERMKKARQAARQAALSENGQDVPMELALSTLPANTTDDDTASSLPANAEPGASGNTEANADVQDEIKEVTDPLFSNVINLPEPPTDDPDGGRNNKPEPFTSFKEIMVEKKDWFILLGTKGDPAPGRICAHCVADPTITVADPRFSDLVEHQSTFVHSRARQFWRHLYLITDKNTVHLPAFINLPQGSDQPTVSNLECPWCDHVENGRGPRLLKHIFKYHAHSPDHEIDGYTEAEVMKKEVAPVDAAGQEWVDAAKSLFPLISNLPAIALNMAQDEGSSDEESSDEMLLDAEATCYGDGLDDDDFEQLWQNDDLFGQDDLHGEPFQ